MGYVTVTIKGKEYKIDRKLKEKLDNIKKIQKRDWDAFVLGDGMEGSGKSTLIIFCAYYLTNGNLTAYNICSDGKEAIERLEKLRDKSVLVIDEGSLVFSSKDTLAKEQRRIIKILNVIRQKRMVLFIVAPSFFDLNKYISCQRSRFLLHVYTDKKLNRGRYCYFGEKKKRLLYMIGKKNFNSYRKPRADFVGRFEDFKPPFYKEYLETKRKSLMSALHSDDRDDERTSLIKEQRNKYIIWIRKNKKVSHKKLGEIGGLSPSAIQSLLKQHQDKTNNEIKEEDNQGNS